MSNIKSLSWGTTQIKFFPAQLAEKDVRKAADAVALDVESKPDSFVVLDKEGPVIFSVVPTKPKATQFATPTQGIGIQEAMRQALEKAANFLKGQS